MARFRGSCIAFGLPKLLFLVLRYVASRAIIFSLLRRVRVLVGDGSVSMSTVGMTELLSR